MVTFKLKIPVALLTLVSNISVNSHHHQLEMTALPKAYD